MYEGRGRNKKNGDFIVCMALLECSNIFNFNCILIIVCDFWNLSYRRAAMVKAGLCIGTDSLQPCCSYKQSMDVDEGPDQKLDIYGSAGDIRGICAYVIILYAGQMLLGI